MPPKTPSQPGLGKLCREADLGLLVTLIHGTGDGKIPLLSHSFAFHSSPHSAGSFQAQGISVGCSW